MKFFTIAELCKSTTADRLGINNRCRQEHVTALTALVDNVLDPLRTWWGKPITVNSGYRCPELNAAVKGSKTSQHMSGQAADIDTGDRQQNKLLFEHIRKNLPFDQLPPPRKCDSRRFQALSRKFDRRPHRSGRGFAVFVQKKKHPRSFPSRFLQISGKKHRCFLAICRSL